MTALQILRKARELISSPAAWCQGTYGTYVMIDFKQTCMEGAIYLTSNGTVSSSPYFGSFYDEQERLAHKYLETAINALYPDIRVPEGKGLIPHFNDTHSHREALHIYDLAIASRSKGLRLVHDSGTNSGHQAVSSTIPETEDRIAAVG